MTATQIAAMLLEDDAKDYIENALPDRPQPKTWGDLKHGDVLYDPEVGAVCVIKPDEEPRYWWNQRVRYVEYNPVYAYGKYAQHLSIKPGEPVIAAYVVGRADDLGDPWELMARLNQREKGE